MVEELDSTKESHQQFKVLHFLKVNTDTTRRSLALEDDNGYEHTFPASVIPMVETFYEKFFNYSADEDTSHFDEYFGAELTTLGLLPEINHPVEVKYAVKQLRSGRATGADGINAELLIYGGDYLTITYATLMNNIFANGTSSIEKLCEGILISLNKPNIVKVVRNTRAITLLSAMRKLLSLIG